MLAGGSWCRGWADVLTHAPTARYQTLKGRTNVAREVAPDCDRTLLLLF